MPYNKETQSIVYVSHYHKRLLKELKKQTRLGLQVCAELAIEDAARKAGILEMRT